MLKASSKMHFALSEKCPRTHTAWADAPLIDYTCKARNSPWSRKAFRTFSSLLPAPWQDHLCLDLNANPCFTALMRFMGDQSKLKDQNEVECIYEILQVCELPLGKVLKHQWE